MDYEAITDLDVAPPSVVKQAAHDFAAALAATPQYRAYERADDALRQDVAAQRVLGAYQSKQRSLRMSLMLGTVSAEERAELHRLQQDFLAQPAIAAFLLAQADLQALCQATANLLSDGIGLNFAGACKKGCC